jgi:hypothetical protein
MWSSDVRHLVHGVPIEATRNESRVLDKAKMAEELSMQLIDL